VLLMAHDVGLPSPRPALPELRRRVLFRRVRLFVAATITYNVIEAVIALAEGTRVSSAALIGFGLDSVIEVSSAAAVAWQFAGRNPEAREKVALRVIAFSFFGLAAFVTVDSVRSLFGFGEAEHSTIGIVLAAVSLAVMPVLSWAQRRAGREVGSLSAVADSKQTLLCTYLSAVLLVGLLLNSLFGWAWADPVAALVIAAVAVREGILAWRGDSCCATPIVTDVRRTNSGGCDCCGAIGAADKIADCGHDANHPPDIGLVSKAGRVGPSSFGVAGRLDWIAHHQCGSHHCQPP
jgi:Cation efflux family